MSNWKVDAIKGKQSEDNARRVLRDLFQEKRITSFRPTKKLSVDDMNGIDFFFALSIKGRRIEIPLQVKSSWTGILHHKSYGSNIYAVNGQSPKLREHIEAIIDDYNSQFGGGKIVNTVTQVVEEERKLEIVQVKPEIEIVDGQPLTSSKNVAEVFGKNHFDVLKAIKNLDCSEEFGRSNFTESSYLNSQNKEQPMYLMTFDGFTFLAMGFTGQKAAQFKEEYIKEFNRMRQQQVSAITVPQSPVDLSRKELLLLALKSEEELEEERRLRQAKEAELSIIQSEKAELEEETIRHMELNYQLSSEVAAIEQILRDDIGDPISIAVNFISKPGAIIPMSKMFEALVDKKLIRKVRKSSGTGFNYFPYSEYRKDERPWFFNRPDYTDSHGNSHPGTLLITPLGLMKTYKSICDYLGIPFDPNIQENLRKRVFEQQQRLNLYENNGDTPPAA